MRIFCQLSSNMFCEIFKRCFNKDHDNNNDFSLNAFAYLLYFNSFTCYFSLLFFVSIF